MLLGVLVLMGIDSNNGSKMEIWTQKATGGNPMGRIRRSVGKCVGLYLAFVLVASLVGTIPFSRDAASNDNRVSYKVTIESMGSNFDPNARKPMGVTLEAVAEAELGFADPITYMTGMEPIEPAGGPGPSPQDAPFWPDVLVYNSTYNQTNPSIGHDSSNNVFVAFEHSWGFDSDIYVSRSTDGGQSWSTIPVANTAANERCPSMTITYSPSAGSERWYVFYEADQFEYAWSNDGITWSRTVVGGTFWSTVTCPYVVAEGDFVVVVAQKYDDQTMFQDTWYIIYTLDGFQNFTGYYWTFWDDAEASGPRATIIDDDEIFVAFNLYDYSDPDPGNWWHDTLVAQGILTGSVSTDSWPYWAWGSGFSNEDNTSPSVASNGRHVIFTQEMLYPVSGMNTSILLCLWTSNLQESSTIWNGCRNDQIYLVFDTNDQKDQKFPMLHQEGTVAHLVWLNSTDINYLYSPDGGNNWMGEPNTGLPIKVNDPGVGTAVEMYHSPDVTIFDSKPGVVWHDSRGNGSVYFSSFGNLVLFTVYTDPLVWDAWVREVGDIWHPPPHTYLWVRGTSHDLETVGTITLPGGAVLRFCYWSDGKTLNPNPIIANASNPQITAVYCCSNSTLIADTNPTGLLVEIDDVQYTAPGVVCCDNDTIHKVHAPSPQPAGPNSWYEFSHWSDSGTQTHYLNVNGTVMLTAYYDLITNQNPVADAGGPYVDRKNFQVNFTGSGSYDPDGTIASYEWDFGDGSPPAFGELVSHTYTSGGNFTVTLNVTDNVGNWDLDITTADISDLPPEPPGAKDAVIDGASLADVNITWYLSADDGGFENDLLNYTVYYGTVYDPSGSTYVELGNVPAGSAYLVHVGAGHGDNNTYFYTLCAFDDSGQKACNSLQLAKVAKHLLPGMQLISIPVFLGDTSTPNVFQTVSFMKITYYDAMAGKRHNWKTYDTRKPYSDLKDVNHSMALWVDVTAESWLTIAGLVPQETTIRLVTGWNFVGYPSFIPQDVTTNLAGANWQKVESFDPANAPWLLRTLTGSDLMLAGEGYWIHVSSDFDWVLSN